MLWCFHCATFTEADQPCWEGKEYPHRRIRVFVPPHPDLEARYAPKVSASSAEPPARSGGRED